MARIRKFSAYRKVERPYTRISKYKKKSYVSVNPNKAIVKYDMGDSRKKYQYRVELKSGRQIQVRHQAFEAARQTANRLLEKTIGKTGYHFKVRTYPHHILRENPLASGAGADRMSTGMQASFGKVIGAAARVMDNQVVATITCNKEHLATALKAMSRAKNKLPMTCKIETVELD